MDDYDIILSNFCENENKLAALLEIRLSHIADLADLLAPMTVPDFAEGDDSSPNACPTLTELSEEIRARSIGSLPPGGREFVEPILSGISTESTARLCKMIASRDATLPVIPTLHTLERARIAYFPAALSGLAGAAFSREIIRWREEHPLAAPGEAVDLVPTESFSAACEEVYLGKSDLCILPVQGSDEGFSVPFLRLAERYELKALLSCTTRERGRGETTFYLYTGKPVRWEQSDRMDICLHLSPSRLLPVLRGLDQLGVLCENLTTLPHSVYDGDACLLRLHFGELDPSVILLYLDWTVPDYSLLGIYKCLPDVLRNNPE